jgi:hypothetical protein
MDGGIFDALTRSMGEGTTRRALVRLLAGGALGGFAAPLILNEISAKPKKTNAQSRRRRKSPAERQAHGQLQAQGKKKRNKKRNRKPVLETPCFLTDCEDRGGQCCDDGSCAAAGACCPETYRCDDGTCIDPLDACCPGQKKCDGGVCVSVDECCPDKKWCPGDYCIPKDQCCPGGLPPLCSECQRIVCENGDYVCRPNPFVKQCPDGSCVAPDACCPDDQPACGFCQALTCENGQAVCKTLTQECPGGEWDAAHCRCKYCEVTCDPDTLMCHSTCPAGHRCEEGRCRLQCESPIRPQLCCVEEFPGQVRCACRWINEICYASGGIAACVPGQTCCPPEAVRSGLCPRACLEAEICQ